MLMSSSDLEKHVTALVRNTVQRLGLPARPTTAQLLYALKLPRAQAAPLKQAMDGCRSGDQILYKATISCVERISFTIFHEVLHILLADDDVVTEQLHEHFYSLPPEEERRALEHLCNLGAAEFILPSEEFRNLLRSRDWEVTCLATAASKFQSSLIAAAFQFVHCHPSPCTVLVCEEGSLAELPMPALDLPLKTGGGQRRGLYVAYMSWNERSYPMCTRVPVPRDHIIQRVWNDGANARGEDQGFFRTKKSWKMPCEVALIGNRAFAAFYPRGRVASSSQQLSLFTG